MISIELMASKKFNWVPVVLKVDDRRLFAHDYNITNEAVLTVGSYKSKFADLPTFGIWADRTESDDELLEELGNGWQGI